jgi:putative transposase
MARIARVVGPGIPHHTTQQGNRRQQTFFTEDDFREYISLMGEWCKEYGTEVWAYCLMSCDRCSFKVLFENPYLLDFPSNPF